MISKKGFSKYWTTIRDISTRTEYLYRNHNHKPHAIRIPETHRLPEIMAWQEDRLRQGILKPVRRLGSRVREELRDEPDRNFLRFRAQRMAYGKPIQGYELETNRLQTEYVPRPFEHYFLRQDENQSLRSRSRSRQCRRGFRYRLRAERLKRKLKRFVIERHIQKDLPIYGSFRRKRGRMVFH